MILSKRGLAFGVSSFLLVGCLAKQSFDDVMIQIDFESQCDGRTRSQAIRNGERKQQYIYGGECQEMRR